MNSLIESVNGWAESIVRLGWPMLWQSSLLIGVVLALDLLLRRKLRAAVRYGLWLVVLVKLLLPPSLALPTGAGWWLRSSKALPSPRPAARMVVTYDADPLPAVPPPVTSVQSAPPPPTLSYAAWALLAAGGGTAMLLLWMLLRWAQVARDAARAQAAPPELGRLVPELPLAGRVKLIDRLQSPAVCGLFRPVILMPRALAEQLPPPQLRAVLLHELIHLRRGDVWVNCLQTLLQIVYWWHPLLWVANARIRRVREEAVDDAVMLALNDEAESYAPTLLEVAKLALHRPLTTLGLVGILESRSSLRRRIERLVDFRPPRRAGLGFVSVLGVIGFAAVAVPMGEAPLPATGPGAVAKVNETALQARADKPKAELLEKKVGLQVATRTAAPDSSTNAAALDQKDKASSLVYDGKLLYEMDKLDEAEAKLKEALKADPQSKAALYYLNLVSEAKYAVSRKLRELPLATPYSRTNLVRTSVERKAIVDKLERIRLNEVSFQGLPLTEVLRWLSDEARKRDPAKTGINFILQADKPEETAPGFAVDPATGLPAAAASQEDLSTLIISIPVALRDVRLADALDAIIKVAPRPLKYSIEDYGIVLSVRKVPDAKQLYIRTYKVDPNTLLDSLRIFGGVDATEKKRLETIQEQVIAALRDQFAKAGADFDSAKNPGKAIFFNDRQGMLIVRGTLADLEVVEAAIQVLNSAPPQIHIKAKFMELGQDDTKAVGFDWFLGNVMVTNSATVGAGGAVVATNVQALSSGPRPVPGGPMSLNGILTDPQYRVVVKALGRRQGAQVIAQPSVTTLSGRQAQCKMAEIRSVVIGVKEQALASPGVASTNGGENAFLEVANMEFGPVLDIRPTLLADGYTINLSVTASVKEFMGYEDNHTNRVTVYVNGTRKQVQWPRPIVRTAQMTSQVNVWDGQTVVLGGLVSESTITLKDRVPVLGSLPLVGKLFRSESKSAQKRNLLVFVTPTLIDPAGNRIHAEEEMPFATNAIPAQIRR